MQKIASLYTLKKAQWPLGQSVLIQCHSLNSGWLKRWLTLGALLAYTVLPAMADSYDMGLKLYGEGHYNTAARFLLEAAKRSDNPTLHYYLADTYLKLDRFSEAQAEYQKVLAIAPNSQAARLSQVGLQELRNYLNGTHPKRWEQSAQTTTDQPDRYQGGPITGENYLDLVTEGGKNIRWSLKKQPLKVFIETSPSGIRNFQPAYVNRVRQALDVWTKVLDQQIAFMPTSNKAQADLRVTWVNGIDTRGHQDETGTDYTAGLTLPKISGNQLQSMDIRLATFDIQGHPQSSDTIYAVAVHEFGHALGLLGHSDNPKDIMYAQNESVVIPSKRDSNTLRLLYSSAADIDNLPPDTRTVDPSRQAALNQKAEQDIQRLEKLAKDRGSALNWLNLGVAYYQKAKGLPLDQSTQTLPIYHQALEATSNAILQEPNNALAYHKRSLVYQELGKYNDALQDIQRASHIEPHEPEYYMLQAWYQANLGQNGQARNALNTYLIYQPSAAHSPDVARIQARIQENSANHP